MFCLDVATDGKIHLQLLSLLVQLATDYVGIDCIDNEVLSVTYNCHHHQHTQYTRAFSRLGTQQLQ